MMEMKEKRLLQVYAFFKGDSRPSFLLQKAASSLSGEGVDVSLTLAEDMEERSVEEGQEGSILAFFDTPEKAGRFTFSAGRAGKGGLSLYGGTPFGISLAEANILSFFQKEEFHSALIYTADWAFPIVSDRDLEKRGAPFLLSLYRGLMLYAAGKEDTLLGAMDRGRKFTESF